MIKFIYYALLAYLIYLVLRFFQSLSRKTPRRPSRPQPSGMMVKDEFCSTYLPREDAIREVYEGKEYFFCSQECRQKYLEQRKNSG
jgi:YHS domain-containing protein